MDANALPKVELHAHLSGSIHSRTLLHLIDHPKSIHANVPINAETLRLLTLEEGHSRTLDECFQIFPIIHSLVNSEDALRYAVKEVLSDFQEDNVVYLELRTGPREIPGISRKQWVHIILDEIDSFHKRNPHGMVCRLILSIDRSKSVEHAQAVRQLLSEMQSDIIVGVELSGDPTKGNWATFEPVFRSIKDDINIKLPVSLHFGEVLNDPEAVQMLDFKPDRLGHAACLTDKTRDALLRSGIPLEICLTSNSITKYIPDNTMQNHPLFTTYHPKKHPFTLCTDDMGIFQTTLSQEWNTLLKHTHMSPQEYKLHFQSSLQQSFCRDQVVLDGLRRKIDAWLENEMQSATK